jgi:hypothetical protein
MDKNIERFLSYVNKTETCWNWIGADNGNGLGYINELKKGIWRKEK